MNLDDKKYLINANFLHNIVDIKKIPKLKKLKVIEKIEDINDDFASYKAFKIFTKIKSSFFHIEDKKGYFVLSHSKRNFTISPVQVIQVILNCTYKSALIEYCEIRNIKINELIIEQETYKRYTRKIKELDQDIKRKDSKYYIDQKTGKVLDEKSLYILKTLYETSLRFFNDSLSRKEKSDIKKGFKDIDGFVYNHYFFISLRYISEKTGISKDTVSRRLKKLHQQGFISTIEDEERTDVFNFYKKKNKKSSFNAISIFKLY